jgi:hypothetical protein
MAAVDDGLGTLARLGHRYHLVLGPPPEVEDWPKVMFHVEAAPNGRLVSSDFERHELGYGWYFTLGEAQHVEGYRAQMAGRGGVGDRSVPMIPGQVGVQPEQPLTPKDNSAIIAEWKASNGHSNGPTGQGA